jgi:oxygen-independent coproporphyrinogen-3 oxidase
MMGASIASAKKNESHRSTCFPMSASPLPTTSAASGAPAAPARPAAPPLQAPTTAGNYFVSNYPPFAYWRPERVNELIDALDRPPAPGVDLGLYTHIPFCRKRCHFCYYKVYTDKDSQEIHNYLEAVLQELSLYAKRPVIGGRRPRFIYFGGGTPSYLSVAQLGTLTDGIKALLPWDAAEEVTFEAEPGTLTDHKLKAIRELGITRLSLGIEHFDDHILEINGRAHRSKEIARAYAYAREIGFPQINIDLIAGMVEETPEKWRETVARAVALQPDSVTIYQMEVPYNTTIYQRMKAEGKLVAPVADWDVKRAWVNYAFDEFTKAGYTVTSATTVVRDPAKVKFLYREGLFSGADILSVGVASFGHLNGVHYQNHHDFAPYVERVQRGELPIFRALTPSADERFIREFILQLKLGQVSRARFAARFGRDPLDRFAEPMQRLQDWGFVSVAGDVITVHREGLLQIDKLLHEFFLPEHSGERYA